MVKRATLTFWYNVRKGGGRGDYAYFLIRPSGGSWRTLRIVRDGTAGWVRFRVNVSGYAGKTVYLRLGMRNDGRGDGAAGVTYIDSLSLEACSR